MTAYHRFKELLKEHITIMVIPGAKGEIRQVKLFKSMVYAIIFFCVSTGLFMMTFSVTMMTNNAYLNQKNKSFANEIQYKNNALESLSLVAETQGEEVSALKDQVALSATYYENKLGELTELEKRVTTLISMLDEKGETSLTASISRSGDLTSRAQGSTAPENIDDIQSLNAPDEITALIDQQLLLYDEMIADVEETLTFLECKPDAMPAAGEIVSGFGPRRDPVYGSLNYHRGIDIANKKGTAISAAGDGIVTFAGWNDSYGNIVVISHGYGYKTVYAHLSAIEIELGNNVKKGDHIGAMGTTGKSTGTHLHFEVHFEGVQINPMKVLAQ